MTKRSIITIDDKKCDGCALCVPNCPEGAIQIIDGKARLVSDLFCDGLGACIGHCPKGAIKIEEREAEPYDEKRVMENVSKHGSNVIKAHLKHLKDHGEEEYLKEAVDFLKKNRIPVPDYEGCGCKSEMPGFSSCPGARVMDTRPGSGDALASGDETGQRKSELTQWPVELHLVPPGASFFKGRDVLISADCVAYALADFHKDYLKGRALAIACPKLDSGQEVYLEKIKDLIDKAGIKTLTVMTMEVPCCMGLVSLVRKAAESAERKVPIEHITVGINGSVLSRKKV